MAFGLRTFCLIVGFCPIFVSAGGRGAYLVDMDGTVHELTVYNGDNGDGKTWTYDRRTETLTLKGYHGRCVYGILQKVVLEKGSINSLAGMYISYPYSYLVHKASIGLYSRRTFYRRWPSFNRRNQRGR